MFLVQYQIYSALNFLYQVIHSCNLKFYFIPLIHLVNNPVNLLGTLQMRANLPQLCLIISIYFSFLYLCHFLPIKPCLTNESTEMTFSPHTSSKDQLNLSLLCPASFQAVHLYFRVFSSL